MSGRKYCGTKPELPQGYTRKGTPYECLRAGIAIGSQLNKEKIRKDLKEQISRQIEERGMWVLRHQIHLNRLNKDEIRSMAVRLTRSNQNIPNYSTMSLERLKQELVNRGFQL